MKSERKVNNMNHLLKRILLECMAATAAVSFCSCASLPKPDPNAKKIADEFMAGIEPEMFCPAELDSDWVSAEPHHPTTNGMKNPRSRTPT